MKKIFAFFTIFALFLAANPVLAKQDKAPKYAPDSEYATENGTYDVPGHPDMKVRVHIHPAKSKPEPAVSSASAVCATDIGSNAVVHPAGWHLKSGDWKYKLNIASVPASVGGDKLATIASRAFGEWQSKTNLNGKVNFVSNGATLTNRKALDGQNIIAWGRTSGSALAVTYTWYYPSSGEVAETDTIMNLKFPWSWTDQSSSPKGKTCADPNSYDAQDILTHELGHWAGLDDEYDPAYVNNTMYGYGGKGEANATTLTLGDIAGVNALY